MNLKDAIPELRDEVKHKKNDTVGIVVAKYPSSNPLIGFRIDVRVGERIYYASPIANWEVVRLNDE